MRFRGEYAFLSNMYERPVRMAVGGQVLEFACAEAAFQAHKDPSRAREFVGLDGRTAKSLGRKVNLPADWDLRRIQAMEDVIRAKFSNLDLVGRLLATGDEPILEENSWGDRYWGVCNGVGENRLGEILMKIRAELADKRAKSAPSAMAANPAYVPAPSAKPGLKLDNVVCRLEQDLKLLSENGDDPVRRAMLERRVREAKDRIAEYVLEAHARGDQVIAFTDRID